MMEKRFRLMITLVIVAVVVFALAFLFVRPNFGPTDSRTLQRELDQLRVESMSVDPEFTEAYFDDFGKYVLDGNDPRTFDFPESSAVNIPGWLVCRAQCILNTPPLSFARRVCDHECWWDYLASSGAYSSAGNNLNP